MDGTQYSLFLALLDDYELKSHRETVEAAQRLLRHQGVGGEDYWSELAEIDAEFSRRAEEKQAPPF